jgi:hypothetical protein
MDGRMDESTDGWTWMGRMEGLIVMKGQEGFSRPILGFKHQEFKKMFAKRPHAFQFNFDTLSEWMDY